MSERRNFTLDDKAAALLDDHTSDNHSELVRELIKEYYSVGVYDSEEAALRLRMRELERKEEQLQSELESVRKEQEQLDDVSDESSVSDVEQIAAEMEIAKPEYADATNPVIKKEAKANGVDPKVLAELVRENAAQEQVAGLQSVSND